MLWGCGSVGTKSSGNFDIPPMIIVAAVVRLLEEISSISADSDSFQPFQDSRTSSESLYGFAFHVLCAINLTPSNRKSNPLNFASI